MHLITIEIAEDNYFTVRENDKSCPDLCWDEMLGVIVELTHPYIGKTHIHMQTDEQLVADKDEQERRIAALLAA